MLDIHLPRYCEICHDELSNTLPHGPIIHLHTWREPQGELVSHCFHVNCIGPWLFEHDTKCPLCNQSLQELGIFEKTRLRIFHLGLCNSLKILEETTALKRDCLSFSKISSHYFLLATTFIVVFCEAINSYAPSLILPSVLMENYFLALAAGAELNLLLTDYLEKINQNKDIDARKELLSLIDETRKKIIKIQ